MFAGPVRLAGDLTVPDNAPSSSPSGPAIGCSRPGSPPPNAALTASDVHQAVDHSPITRYDVTGGYLNLPGLTVHQPAVPVATSEETP